MDLLEELEQLPERAVIRWTMHQRFTYVAVKIGERWYTTATDANTQVPQIIYTTELAHALVGELVTVEYATRWKEIL